MPTGAQGGTVALRVLYVDGQGSQVDPINPKLEIINPSNVTVASNLIPTRNGIGDYQYIYTIAANAPLGNWTARWTGTINGVPSVGDEAFTVVAPGIVTFPGDAGLLLTLAELKQRLKAKDWSSEEDIQHELALVSASKAIRAFSGRNFAAPNITETRTFEYDGSGFLNVDDASIITAVVLSSGGVDLTLDTTQWQKQPHSGPIYDWVRLPQQGVPFSPAMGFTRNYDVLDAERRFGFAPLIVKVTGTFGWPNVPEDVKQAAVWTVKAFISNPEPFAQKSIEGYSVTIGEAPSDAIPERAQALLIPYVRWNA